MHHGIEARLIDEFSNLAARQGGHGINAYAHARLLAVD
jgi:hypothetical protein